MVISEEMQDAAVIIPMFIKYTVGKMRSPRPGPELSPSCFQGKSRVQY